MKDTLVLIGQSLAKRQSSKEKVRFINTIAKPLLDSGIPVQLHRNPNKRIQSNNILIGDMEHCSLVFLCPYDTGRRMLLPHIAYRPLDSRTNEINEKKNLLAYAILGAAGIVGIFLASSLMHSSFSNRLIGLIIDAGCAVLLYFALATPSASVSMNRNSSSCALAAELSKTPYRHTSFIFTDQCIESNLGYRQVRDWYQKDADQRTFVLLDSLSSGKNLYIVSRHKNSFIENFQKQTDATYVELTDAQAENTALGFFRNSILITSGILKDGQIEVTPSRTNEDYHIDVSRLEHLQAVLAELIQAHEAE
jgi:hypothetical protein